MRKFFIVIIILFLIGMLTYQIYKSSISCWPFCPGLNEEGKEVIREGLEQSTSTSTSTDGGVMERDLTEEERNQIEQNLIKAGCPDEMIVNKMPGVGSGNDSYYIKDGKRVEISEYNNIWVKANCEVPVQEVY